jgi:hypothetical protein
MDWLKEVIDNKELKDDYVVTLAGGKTVQLGEIRNLTKASQKLLTDREANLAAQEAQLKKNLETLQLAQAETAKLYAELNQQKTNKGNDDNKGQLDPLDSLVNDAILGPLAKAYKNQQVIIDELKVKALQPLVKAQQDMAAIYVQDRIEDLYDRTVPDKLKATVSLESILKVANDNNLRNKYGVPDIRAAYRQMSTKALTQEDIDAQLKAAREEGKKEAMEAARLRVPRPGIGSVSGRPESSFKPTKLTSVSDALGEALAAAAKDADIWSAVDQTN